MSLVCVTLLACPAGTYYDYQFVGTKLPNDNNSDTRIEYNQDFDLYIGVTYFYQYGLQRQNGLVAKFKTNTNVDLTNVNPIQEVKSSTFGTLNRVQFVADSTDFSNTNNAVVYNLIFEKRQLNRTLRKTRRDTISIALVNGKTLLFVGER